jgi:hypothetical protein
MYNYYSYQLVAKADWSVEVEIINTPTEDDANKSKLLVFLWQWVYFFKLMRTALTSAVVALLRFRLLVVYDQWLILSS